MEPFKMKNSKKDSVEDKRRKIEINNSGFIKTYYSALTNWKEDEFPVKIDEKYKGFIKMAKNYLETYFGLSRVESGNFKKHELPTEKPNFTKDIEKDFFIFKETNENPQENLFFEKYPVITEKKNQIAKTNSKIPFFTISSSEEISRQTIQQTLVNLFFLPNFYKRLSVKNYFKKNQFISEFNNCFKFNSENLSTFTNSVKLLVKEEQRETYILKTVLEKLSNDFKLSKSFKSCNKISSSSNWINFITTNANLISKNFYFQTNITTFCKNCNQRNTNYEISYYLEIIEDKEQLEKSLSFCAPSNCSKCENLLETKKTYESLPNYLLILFPLNSSSRYPISEFYLETTNSKNSYNLHSLFDWGKKTNILFYFILFILFYKTLFYFIKHYFIL